MSDKFRFITFVNKKLLIKAFYYFYLFVDISDFIIFIDFVN